MHLFTAAAEAQRACREAPRPLALVPTMGALHTGHMSLVHRAREDNATVVGSIFVNPLQFGPTEDLDVYPRSLERDLELLREAGTDIAFAPSPEQLYPPGFATAVEVQGPALPLEGQARPGYFRGVATAVAMLLSITLPDRLYLGQKDGQQVAVIRRLVVDLNIPVTLVVLPTIREPDGLAMSSRNVYLSPEERAAAPVVYRALQAAQERYRRGERRREALEQACRAVLEQESLVRTIDYVALVDPDTFNLLDRLGRRTGMLAVAVHMGSARLIDNTYLGPMLRRNETPPGGAPEGVVIN